MIVKIGKSDDRRIGKLDDRMYRSMYRMIGRIGKSVDTYCTSTRVPQGSQDGVINDLYANRTNPMMRV